MGFIDTDKTYKAPQTKVVEVSVHGVLCQSPGAFTVDGYTEENLDW